MCIRVAFVKKKNNNIRFRGWVVKEGLTRNKIQTDVGAPFWVCKTLSLYCELNRLILSTSIDFVCIIYEKLLLLENVTTICKIKILLKLRTV